MHFATFCAIIFLYISHAQTQQGNLRINTDLTAPASERTPTSAQNDAAAPTASAVGNSLPKNLTATPTHICTREETYVERIQVPTMEPVRVRTSNWCLEFPPRCTSYTTTMRERIDIQNINKTRTIRFCCEGYEGNISNSDNVCKPVCRGGCGRGFCQKPDVCSCEAGYTGKHCTQRCDHDLWGLECRNLCQCKNDAVCDNKSGICHCTSGWTGQFCELPCPTGTYGVMCRKQCTCGNHPSSCHPQTGACAGSNASTLPELVGDLPNVTHHMIETLNSTIANITHNLDRIAKNIGQIAPSVTEQSNELMSKTMPEVILIKQDEPQHTPKIIVHQPGTDILENLHSAGAAKTPEVIHVITSWPTNATPTQESKINLAGLGTLAAAGIELTPTSSNVEQSEHAKTAAEHDANLLTTLLIILIIIMIGIAVSFLYVYRRYHWQKERVQAALAARTNGSLANSTGGLPPNSGVLTNGELVLKETMLNKSFLKPLPDLPAFTQAICNKIDGPELYDSPSNNSSIKTPPYAYARKESLYSVVTPKSRKGSLDSHLYDEIRYPGHHHHHHHHHQQQHQHHQQHHHTSRHSQSPSPVAQPQLRYAHATTAAAYLPPAPGTTGGGIQNPPIPAHHVSHFVIPPQNSKYLQVPQLNAQKVAHL